MTWHQLLEPYPVRVLPPRRDRRHDRRRAVLGSSAVRRARGMSSIGHGLSPRIFGGAPRSAVVGFNFFAGAGLWGSRPHSAIGRVSRRRVIGSDAAIGAITTAPFALGLALIGIFGTARQSIDARCSGASSASRPPRSGRSPASPSWPHSSCSSATALLFTTFDPEVAEVSGVSPGRTRRVAHADARRPSSPRCRSSASCLVAAHARRAGGGGPAADQTPSRTCSGLGRDRGGLGFVGMNLELPPRHLVGGHDRLVSSAAFLVVFLFTGPLGLRAHFHGTAPAPRSDPAALRTRSAPGPPRRAGRRDRPACTTRPQTSHTRW